MTINEKIFGFIENKGMKNSFLAEKMDISPQYLGQILNGKKNVTLDFLLELKKLFPEIDLNKMTENVYPNIAMISEPGAEYQTNKAEDIHYNSLLEIKKILEKAQI